MGRFKRHLSALVFCNFYRLIRVIPNNDPIIGFALPFAKQDRWWQAALFPFLAMVSFDAITARLGSWTLITAVTYGLIGFGFHAYFKQKKLVSLGTYARSAIAGVLVFDFITGPLLSSFLFRMPFEAALIGQIPFTISHLASGVALTLLIAPAVDPSLHKQSLLHRIGWKTKLLREEATLGF